jgi:hypothetical protein
MRPAIISTAMKEVATGRMNTILSTTITMRRRMILYTPLWAATWPSLRVTPMRIDTLARRTSTGTTMRPTRHTRSAWTRRTSPRFTPYEHKTTGTAPDPRFIANGPGDSCVLCGQLWRRSRPLWQSSSRNHDRHSCCSMHSRTPGSNGYGWGRLSQYGEVISGAFIALAGVVFWVMAGHL